MTASISDAELSALSERTLDLIADLRSAEERIKKNIGYSEDVAGPVRYAQTFSGLSAAASDLARAILIPVALAEDKARIEAQLRARA